MMQEMRNEELFSGRAKDYTEGRPAYAQELIEKLYRDIGFSAESVIADVGSGTGKFAKQILEKGSYVICVEPNVDMRQIAEKELSLYSKVQFVNGNADNTKIADSSVDFITAAQAFHWFDVEGFYTESKRILKPEGKVILIWNTRERNSKFNAESYEIYSKYCPRFKGFGGGIVKDDERINEYFHGEYQRLEFENPLIFDRNKFISRNLSSSYSIKKGELQYCEYIDELNGLFDKYAEKGKVIMPNKTTAYVGKI